jgi:hypothetical protein
MLRELSDPCEKRQEPLTGGEFVGVGQAPPVGAINRAPMDYENRACSAISCTSSDFHGSITSARELLLLFLYQSYVQSYVRHARDRIGGARRG